jgi:hypothetical protein
VKPMRHGCASSLLKQNRLECNNNMQFHQETKNSERVILLLNCDTNIELMARRTAVTAKPPATVRSECETLFTGTDLDICRQVPSFSATVNPTGRMSDTRDVSFA